MQPLMLVFTYRLQNGKNECCPLCCKCTNIDFIIKGVNQSVRIINKKTPRSETELMNLSGKQERCNQDKSDAEI